MVLLGQVVLLERLDWMVLSSEVVEQLVVVARLVLLVQLVPLVQVEVVVLLVQVVHRLKEHRVQVVLLELEHQQNKLVNLVYTFQPIRIEIY